MKKLKIKTQSQDSTKPATPKLTHSTNTSFVIRQSSIVRRGMKDEARGPKDDGRRTKLIPLTQGQFAIVDADDYERLAVHKWCLGGKKGQYYAKRKDHQKIVMMHREIIDIPAGMVCDHINHNGLDNRRCNIRICTPAQNQHNRLPSRNGTSQYKGVCRDKASHKWRAYIGYQNRWIHIGYFEDEQEAAIAYDDMAIKLFGEFACLNCQYRPEIRQWIEQMYLFPPMEVDLDFINQSNHHREKSYISL